MLYDLYEFVVGIGEKIKMKLCAELYSKISAMGNRIINLNNDLSKCLIDNNVKNEIIKTLKMDEDLTQKPEWMTDKHTYHPKINVEGGSVMLLNPRDIYAVSDSLEKIVKKNVWLTLEHDRKLYEIWRFVIFALRYKYDQNENWQFPSITLNRKYGDCEDGTILFVTLCKIAKIPASMVFNCVGYVNKQYYHSFPIAKMQDDKWYIFESTLEGFPSGPKLFKGSGYDAESGLFNWKFAGKIKEGLGDQI